MKLKRILACFTAAVIYFVGTGYAGTVYAEEKHDIIVSSNFDENINGWRSYGPGSIKRVTPGADGSAGCIYNESTGIGFCLKTDANMIEGETYDVTMYVKVIKPTSFTVYTTYPDNSYFMILNNFSINYANEWKKITFPITYSGTTSSGRRLTSETATFNFRLGNGQVIQPFYLDEVTIVSRNNVSKPAEESNIQIIKNEFYSISEPNFTDIKGHWGEPTIYALAGNQIISGYENGKFEPENNISRAETLEMIVSAMKLTKNIYDGAFSDVVDADWYAQTVQTAYNIGIIDDNKMFYPNNAATRKDVALWLYRMSERKNIRLKKDAKIFDDCKSLSEEYQTAILALMSAGIANGYTDKTFRPEEYITRAEVCELLKGVIEITDKILVVVKTDGDDKNAGTLANPVKSMNAAKNIVRKYNKNMQYNIYVLFENGSYYMPSAVDFLPEDSGSNGYSIVYGSFGYERAVFTGGKEVKNFVLYDSSKNIYKASLVENGITIADVPPRQFYVNGVKGTRARSEGGLSEGTEYEGSIGYRTPDVQLADYKKPEDLEFVYTYGWTNGRCGVEKIERDGNTAVITMSSLYDAWYWCCNGVGNSRFRFPIYYENAYELLDEPGEWYIDSDSMTIFYIPRRSENLAESECILPLGEGFVDLRGTIDKNVCNIRFENVDFEYATWLRPSRQKVFKDSQGIACADVNTDVNKMRYNYADGEAPTVEAAVSIKNGNNIDFEKCDFTKLGAAAVSFTESIKNCDVTGCEIYNISNAGINMGSYSEKWILPADYRYVSDNNTITNNYIHDIGTDYWDSIGIQISTLKNTTIKNNEVFKISYSGIASGWGWDNYKKTATENLQIANNYIHMINTKTFDGGPIYNVGATGGSDDNRSVIDSNYMEYTLGYPGGLYLDQSSSWFLLTNNVLDHRRHPALQGYAGEKHETCWLDMWSQTIRNNKARNNYSTTKSDLAPFKEEYNDIEDVIYIPDGNWPEEAVKIIEQAGISQEYKYLFPDTVQEIINGTDIYYVSAGDCIELDFKALARKGREVPIDYSKLVMYSDDSCVSVENDGKLFAKSQGQADVNYEYLDSGNLITGSFKVCVDDMLSDVEFNVDDKIELFVGDEYSIDVLSSKSLFGADMEITGVNYSIDGDAAEAKTEANSIILKAVKSGESKMKIDYRTILGNYTKEFTISVNEYPDAKGQNLDAFKHYIKKELINKKGWTGPNNLSINFTADNVSFGVPDGVLAYKAMKYNNTMLCFDMQIDAEPGGWPSIALRASSPEAQYMTSDCYIITFGQGYLELQRFNSGKRNVIYGNVIEGSGGVKREVVGSKGGRVECEFEYGKKYNIELGTINTAEGVRIIVSIDGKRYIDCIDSDEERIEGAGYMTFYVRSGEMHLFPSESKR